MDGEGYKEAAVLVMDASGIEIARHPVSGVSGPRAAWDDAPSRRWQKHTG
jgi:hypothetical protein